MEKSGDFVFHFLGCIVTSSQVSIVIKVQEAVDFHPLSINVVFSVTVFLYREKERYSKQPFKFLLIRRFLLVTPPDYHNHVLSWISKNSRFLRMEDITSKYACLGTFGPEGIGLLQSLTLTSLDSFSVGENKVLAYDRFLIDFLS